MTPSHRIDRIPFVGVWILSLFYVYGIARYRAYPEVSAWVHLSPTVNGDSVHHEAMSLPMEVCTRIAFDGHPHCECEAKITKGEIRWTPRYLRDSATPLSQAPSL